MMLIQLSQRLTPLVKPTNILISVKNSVFKNQLQYSAVTPSPEKVTAGQKSTSTTPKARLPSTTEEPEEYEPQASCQF